jgi:hypothetical protein
LTLQRPALNIAGLRRADLLPLLTPCCPATLTRHLARLRKLGVIRRVTGTYRYYLTPAGRAAIAAGRRLTEHIIIPALANKLCSLLANTQLVCDNSVGLWDSQPDFAEPPLPIEGEAAHYNHYADDDQWEQAGNLFRLMTSAQQQVLFENTARAMGDARHHIKERHIRNCWHANPAYGAGVARALGLDAPPLPRNQSRWDGRVHTLCS